MGWQEVADALEGDLSRRHQHALGFGLTLDGPNRDSRAARKLAMVFKLLLSARKKWRRLDGSKNLAEVVKGVTFKDGIKQIQHAA